MKRYDHSNITEIIKVGREEARRMTGPLSILLGDLAGHLERQWNARDADVAEIQRLRELVVRLGGGFDRRGLDGDPLDKRVPTRIHMGSIVDMDVPL